MKPFGTPPDASPQVAPTAAAPRPARSAPRWAATGGRVAFWAAVAGLVALNVARLCDRWWPPADLGAINQLLGRNRGEDAERALLDRLRRYEFDGDARLTLARLLARRGDMAAAARESRLVPPWWPGKPEALVLEGQAAAAAGLAVEAEAAWRACLADDPLHPAPPRIFSAAANGLIGLLSLEGRQDEAIAALWPIYDNSTEADRPTILRTITDLRAQGGRCPTDPAAAATLERYAAADPADLAARRALAKLAQAGHDWEAAGNWLDAALAVDPGDLAARLDRLAVWEDRRATARSDAELAELAPRAAADPRFWASEGRQRERRNDFGGAAEAYRRAAELQPAEPSTLDDLARALDRAGAADEAQTSRCRARAIRDARQAVPGALRNFVDAANQHRSPAELAPLRAHLADLAGTLGWSREASAWAPPRRPDSPAQPDGGRLQ